MTARIVSAEEARGLLAGATPGPWHMEHASKAPPGEEWGEVVARLHPAGGAGAPVPGMRLTWSRRSVGVLAERNARLIAASHSLAHTVIALEGALMEALTERAGFEARAIKAERARDAALARVARLEEDNAALWRDLHTASEAVAKRNARMQAQLDRVFPVESREVEARIADLVSVVLDCETATMATHRHVPRPILAMQRKVERLEAMEAADAAGEVAT